MNFLARLARKVYRGEALDFVSFWHGHMDGLTYGCLASFPYHSARLRLYCYDDKIQVPAGIELADARDICSDESLIGRYIADGKVELSKFSNLFRYLLIQRTGYCWVDCDFLCLRAPEFQHDDFVFGYQLPKDHPSAINGAVLKLPRENAVLADLVQHARSVVDLDQRWGTIGPSLVTPKLREAGLCEFGAEIADYYPISYAHFWKLLLPEERESVEAAANSSKLLHLWHHMFELARYDKELAPPKDSYLHRALERVGALDRFKRTYEADEVRASVAPWLASARQQSA